MKNLLIFSLILVIVGFGCKKTEIQHFSSSIVGEWSWIRTVSEGITVIVYTPKSTNERINLVFTADSICNTYQNDTLKGSNRFHIYKNIINYENSQSQAVLITHDTLVLDNDNYGSEYKRVK